MNRFTVNGREIDMDEFIASSAFDMSVTSILQTLEECVVDCAKVALESEDGEQRLPKLVIAKFFIDSALKSGVTNPRKPEEPNVRAHHNARL